MDESIITRLGTTIAREAGGDLLLRAAIRFSPRARSARW